MLWRGWRSGKRDGLWPRYSWVRFPYLAPLKKLELTKLGEVSIGRLSGLENRRGLISVAGSNPVLSATF